MKDKGRLTSGSLKRHDNYIQHSWTSRKNVHIFIFLKFLQIIMLSELSQTKYYMVSLTRGIKKKKDTNELTYKTETNSQM